MGVETGKDLPNLLFSDCRGRSAHLVPEEKMVLKAQRVEVVPMVILVPWDPLGRRFVFAILCFEVSECQVASPMLGMDSGTPE